MASTSAAAEFYSTFQTLKNNVESALETAEAASKLSLLRSELAAARSSLPPYDQRSYDNQIRNLEAKLAAKRGEKKSKFAFKRQTASASAPPPAPVPAPAPAPAPSPTPPPADTPTYTLSSRQNTRLTEADFSPSGSYTLTISHLSHCVVDLRHGSATLTSLHASNLDTCLLLLPRMAGSAMLSDLTRCVVVLGAQQFRLHNTTNTVVLLHVPSLPVIEGCKGVMVGAYPFESGVKSRHAEIQDFDWVRAGPSPNWRLLSAQEEDDVNAVLDKNADAIQSIPCIQTQY